MPAGAQSSPGGRGSTGKERNFDRPIAPRNGFLPGEQATMDLAGALTGDGITVINTDRIENSTANDNRDMTLSPDAYACILYTSGSTGLPKGILHSHRTILHHIWSHTHTFQISSTDRQALLLSYSFAASISEIFGALLNGATLSMNYVKKTGMDHLSKWLQALQESGHKSCGVNIYCYLPRNSLYL